MTVIERSGIEVIATQTGVTASEFARMCEKHLLLKAMRIGIDDTLVFLNNCCALGVLRREFDRGTTVYFPTGETLLWIEDGD